MGMRVLGTLAAWPFVVALLAAGAPVAQSQPRLIQEGGVAHVG